MYIIAKNKDYYDGVVGSVGIDKTIVYERSPVELSTKETPKQFIKSNDYGWRTNRDNPFTSIGYADIDRKATKKYDDNDFFIVGFCGKLYLGWKLYYKVKERGLMGIMEEVTKTDIVYGYENVKDILKISYWRNNIENDVKTVMDFNPIEIFREVKAPIFTYEYGREYKFTVNPILKDFKFYKEVDAFTAFTELQMFVSGVLGVGEKELIEVEDKYKIGQHGFDKWSFRREPTKKRGR
jgi:hypothetical protein